MDMMFNLEIPINPTSFGQVGWGVCYEIFKRGLTPNIFPIGEVDLRAFQEDTNFTFWLQMCIEKAPREFSANDPTITLWHINGSHKRLSNKKNILWTAHETSMLTPTEANILNNYQKVFTTSNYSKKIFTDAGVKNVKWCPNYFDSIHLHKIETPKLPNDPITFGLSGKLEKRKNTRDIIVSWANMFAGKSEYRLNCCIFNPFLDPDMQSREIHSWFGGRIPWNIKILPFQVKNSDYNKDFNSWQIDLSGLSGAEGWGLPCFSSICLGKTAIVLDAHAHKDYATKSNSILVEPNGEVEIYDGAFFQKGHQFNQGNMFTFSQDAAHEAFKKALDNLENPAIVKESSKLRKQFSVANTVDTLLNI